MHFLDRLSPPARERLLAAGHVVRMQPGDLLVRRGGQGGDMYLVEEGAFEVVDRSTQPEVVLGQIGAGQVIGELSFMDRAPRSADVRASGEAAARVWEREALLGVFAAEPDIGAAFFEALALSTVSRLRLLNENVRTGALSTDGGRSRVGAGELEQARRIAERVQGAWLEADATLRRDPDDGAATRSVHQGFDLLMEQATTWLRGFPDPTDAAEAGELLSRDLRPYLVRSTTAELCLDPPSHRSGDPRLVAHMLVARPRGDGGLGTIIDGRLLGLPTCAGVRRRTELAARSVAAALPDDRRARLMFVNATCGALLARLVPELARIGADIQAVDGSREALAFLDAGLPTRPPGISLKLVQEDLGALVLGLSDARFELSDFVVVDALLDYLPDRLAAALMSWVRDHLAPGGLAVLTGLAPSPDAAVLDHVLGWPLVRRSAPALRSLVEACGLQARVVAGGEQDVDPAVVVTARRPREPQASLAVR
jgi:CRP-like cAMP-binding protein